MEPRVFSVTAAVHKVVQASCRYREGQTGNSSRRKLSTDALAYSSYHGSSPWSGWNHPGGNSADMRRAVHSTRVQDLPTSLATNDNHDFRRRSFGTFFYWHRRSSNQQLYRRRKPSIIEYKASIMPGSAIIVFFVDAVYLTYTTNTMSIAIPRDSQPACSTFRNAVRKYFLKGPACSMHGVSATSVRQLTSYLELSSLVRRDR